jgi:hypothetical protein
MNLGTKMKSTGSELVASTVEKEPKITYPSFTLNDEIAKAFLKECDCELGDEVTCTAKLKITRRSEDEFGSSIGFDVLSLDDISETEETSESGDEQEPDDEEKVLGYKRKVAPKEAPTLKAADLED